MSRKLATIRTVSKVEPIENSDFLEVATIDSWKIVVKKGEITPGSRVVYFEIDSWIPTSLAPFLTKESKEPSVYNGLSGERLRTIKLRGQISQGLIMSIDEVINARPECKELLQSAEDHQDLTDILGLIKWEAPLSILNYEAKGNYPEDIHKTDQPRFQNFKRSDLILIKESTWEVTEKCDGTSVTIYYKVRNGIVYEGVCSRNFDLKKEDEDGTINSYWSMVLSKKLLEKIKESGLNLALQGEIVGHKIGPNIYKMTSRDFYLFDIYDIDTGLYYDPKTRQEFAKKYDIQHVPILFNDYTIPDIDNLLTFAEGKSVLNKNTEREGLVFKNMSFKFGLVNSFKVISNKFLLKHE